MYKYITLLEICQVHWGGVEDDGLVLTAVQEMHELEEGSLGAAASGIGQLLYAYRLALTKVGGVVIVVFGLHTLGVLKIPFLYYDTRRRYRPRPELGYLSSALMGFFFGAGWSPCVEPVLGAILTLALSEATVEHGAPLFDVGI
jgi:cytochrome c-type biogenesis protein